MGEKYEAFCSIQKSEDDFLDAKAKLSYKTDKCLNANGTISSIESLALNFTEYTYKESEKTLNKICTGRKRAKGDFHVTNLSFNLPNNKCICNILNLGFNNVREQICTPSVGNEEPKAFKEIKKSFALQEATNLKKELDLLKQEYDFFGQDNFCPNMKMVNCTDSESIINDHLKSGEFPLFDFLNGKDFKLDEIYNSISKRKKQKGLRKELNLSGNLAEYLFGNNDEARKKLRNSKSSNEAQKALGKKANSHIKEMLNLRIQIKKSGGLDKLVTSKLADKSKASFELENFCKIDPNGPKELNEIKVLLFTHQDISHKTCGDGDSPQMTRNKSKRLLEVMTASANELSINSKGVLLKAPKPFKKSIDEQLRDDFLQEAPLRCENISFRMEHLCGLNKMPMGELMSLSKNNQLTIDNEFMEKMKLENGREALESLSCFYEPSVSANQRMGSFSASNGKVPTGAYITSGNQISRTEISEAEDEQALEEERIAVAEEMAKLLQDSTFADNPDSPESQEAIRQVREEIRELTGKDIDPMSHDLKRVFADLRNESQIRYHKKLAGMANALNNERGRLVSKKRNASPQMRDYFQSKINKIDRDLNSIKTITGKSYDFSKEQEKFYADTPSSNSSSQDTTTTSYIAPSVNTDTNSPMNSNESNNESETESATSEEETIANKAKASTVATAKAKKSGGRSPSSISGGGSSAGGGSAVASTNQKLEYIPIVENKKALILFSSDEEAKKVLKEENLEMVYVYNNETLTRFKSDGKLEMFSRDEVINNSEKFEDKLISTLQEKFPKEFRKNSTLFFGKKLDSIFK